MPERIPRVLDVQEIASLLTELQHPYKTMVLLAAATGLRASELLALKWQDVDFESLEIRLNRGVVHQMIGELKTEASQKPLPLYPELAHALREWQHMSPFDQQPDWVFASPEMKGQQPYWPESIAPSHSTSREEMRHPQDDRLAHIPPQLRNVTESEW